MKSIYSKMETSHFIYSQVECDYSPGDPILDSLKLIDVAEIEIDAGLSEHEKSDSEQEKDAVPSLKPEPGSDIPSSAPSKDEPGDDTPGGDLNLQNTTGKENNPKPVKKKVETDKPAAVVKVEKSSQKSVTPAARREKSEDKSKMSASRTSAAFNKTTFASTVKSMSKVLPARAAGTAPRMTRALTTISPANKPVIARKTTAGLLITSQRLQSAPAKLSNKKPETPR